MVNFFKIEFITDNPRNTYWLFGIMLDFTLAGISPSQMSCIDKCLVRLDITWYNPVSTPHETNHYLIAATVDDAQANATAYQHTIGSLISLVTATCSDQAYTIAHLSSYNLDPKEEYFFTAKHVLWYLQGTKNRALLFPYNILLTLSAFSDISWVNCLHTRRCFSGSLFHICNIMVLERSYKQYYLGISTCEAEYMTLYMTGKHHEWLLQDVQEFL